MATMLARMAIVAAMAAGTVNAAERLVWVEAETAQEKAVFPNVGLDEVDTDELSGGAWLSSFSEPGQPAGTATCAVEVPEAGKYVLWLRAHPRGTGFAFRLDAGDWVAIDAKAMQAEDKAARDEWVKQSRAKRPKNAPPAPALPEPHPRVVDPRPVSLDGSPGFRELAWINVGTFDLARGRHTLSFKLGGDGDINSKRYSAIDCFVLASADFVPNAKFKPGENWPTIVEIKPEDSWAFAPAPDALGPDAILDLRSLNEKVAGEHGFIRLSADGMDFVRGDGQPIRFWGGTDYNQRNLSIEDMVKHARFLAKRGVNIARWHGDLPVDAPKRNQPAGATKLTDIDEKELDEAFKLVAGMKRAGIYTILSPYWGSHTNVQPGWNVPDNANLAALVFFYPPVQQAYKGWLKELYTRPNPYTKIPLKDDPAVAMIQLQNEDSMLFWTMQRVAGEPLMVLRKQFAEWVKRKHGSYEKAMAAWENYAHEQDDAKAGIPGMFIIWEFTADARAKKGGAPGREQRLSDQLQFMGETMYNFNREIARYLREELGCKQLINAGNWRTCDPALVEDVERWSYTANEVLGKNHYFSGQHKGINVGWQILPHHYYSNPSGTLKPEALPVNIKQAVGHAFIIPESLWVPPMLYQSEGPLMVAAQTCLTGADTFFWFANGAAEWQEPGNKWTFATPMQLGQFPAAALIYRQGYVKRGEPAIVEERSLQNLWDRKMPLIAEGKAWDPNRDAGDLPEDSSVKATVDPLAFLVGPVLAKYGGEPSKSRVSDLKPFIDREKKIVRSNTGEIVTDFGRGLYTVNAPMAQATAGFLAAAGPVRLADVTIDCRNEYATVAVVPLDDKPIGQSESVLVQVGTVCRPAGFKARPAKFKAGEELVEGFRILDTGKGNWQVENTRATVSVANRMVQRATLLDMNGQPVRDVELKREAGRVQVELPAEAVYIVLQKG